ncbi:hypothetical protein [Nocardioides sp. SYSU D00065]|uniref:hypothetical protein n=1 Tax=Nocardioides sp. SYSU D00065 TaxID=2817378 RepID=UPI001B31C76B|nr:hypothetical protein [Nocardioides sp. SYSU D00065]
MTSAASTDDPASALGTVLDEDRGALPYQLIHGESLVACAAWALGEAGVRTLDLGTSWSVVVDSGEPFVVHDSLCPMTPAPFIAGCVERAVAGGVAVVGVGEAGTALSPVVLPAAVAAELAALPSSDVAELVRELESLGAVDRVVAPLSAARVSSAADVAALERLTAPESA